MDNVYAIIISDFHEKINFLFTKPDFELNNSVKIAKSLNKSVCMNYSNENKNQELKLFDAFINSHIKIKITILCEVVVNILYDSEIDINYINLVNQRFIEAVHLLAKTKKVKMEHLNKRYIDTCLILEDTVHLMDPRMRLMTKDRNLRDMIGHSIYIEKFSKAGIFLRSLAFYHSAKEYMNVKQKVEKNKQLRSRNMKGSFGLGEDIIKFAKLKRNTVLHLYGAVSEQADFAQLNSNVNKYNSKTSSVSSTSQILLKNSSQQGMITDMNSLDFSALNSGNTKQKVLSKAADKDTKKTNPLNNSVSTNTSHSKNKSLSVLADGFGNVGSLAQFNSSGVGNKANNKSGNSDNPKITIPSTNHNAHSNSPTKRDPMNTNKNTLGNTNSPIKSNISKFNSSGGRTASTIDKVLSSLQEIDFTAININLVDNTESTSNSKLSNNEYSKDNPISNPTLDSLLNTDLLKSSPDNKSHRSGTVINTNKSVDFNFNNLNLVNPLNMNTSANSHRKSVDIVGLSNILLQTSQLEDRFDPTNIKKQIRGAIIEKGILLNNKGTYEDVKYRGQIALELSNNFTINNKSLYLKAIHPYWNDNNYFTKLIPDKNLVEDQNFGNYKLNCQNVKSFLRLIDYNINIKLIEPAVEFKVTGAHKEGKYKLEIHCLVNEKFRNNLKSSQMVIVIVTKTNEISILKSTDNSYTLEEKKITFNLSNFNSNQKFLIGMLFQTEETEFVEVVKVMYRFMDVLPTSNNAELYYYDENNNHCQLDLIKKCMVEVRFIP